MSSCLFNICLLRIVLVIFISTHDSLSSPLNHSAVVTSVIIRVLTQETICQIQNSSWKSSQTTLWNNIRHNYGVNSRPRWQRKKPVTRSITQVLLKLPLDLWLVITVDCGFHRSIAKTWWETSVITSCRPSLGAERVAKSADGPHLIEFPALRFNPLSFRANVRQHKTLSHVSFCLSSVETPAASTSTCSVQQPALHSRGCSHWLQSHRQLRLQGEGGLTFFTAICRIGRLQIHSFCQMSKWSLRCLMFSQKSLFETSHWGARHCRLTVPMSASSIWQGRH